MRLYWLTCRVWLANRILPRTFVAFPVEWTQEYLQMVQAQQQFYALLDRHPHLKTTAVLLPDVSRRLM